MGPLDQCLLALEPQYRERVWGGQHLRAANPPIGEAWAAYGPSIVTNGPLAGRTLDEIVAEHGRALLGGAVSDRFGTRFPLLIKLLDCADWLSVQVHPNDEQARRMVGPNEFGKTEAWYFLAAEPDARSLIGVKPGVQQDDLTTAIREGRILGVANSLAIAAGEAILIPAGTLHALGPGIILYEVQQASDTTYRVYDWGRPKSTGRQLHIDESIEVSLPLGPAPKQRPVVEGITGTAPAVDCRYFHLDLVCAGPGGERLEADTAGRSFHILTAIEGTAEVRRGPEVIRLGRFETALVAGGAGAYEISGDDGPATLLRAAVPA